MKQNVRKLRVVGSKSSSYQYDDPERIAGWKFAIVGAAGLLVGLGAMIILFHL
jgi:proteasome assembly chaperone (PAC2) family protein